MRRGLRAILLALVLSQPALASPERLREAATLIAAAGVQMQAAQSAEDRMRALSEALRAHEHALAILREGLRGTAREERRLTAAFEAEQRQMAALLAALQRVEHIAVPASLLHPGGALAALRAGIIFNSAGAKVATDAAELKLQLYELAELRRLQAAAADDLQRALSAMQTLRAELVEGGARRRAQNPPDASLEILRATARDLGALATALAREQTGVVRVEDFAARQGTLPLPVLGTLQLGFGARDAAGLVRRGIVLAASTQSLVSAPVFATVRFSGEFANFQGVVILEPQDGYLIVLAGMDRLFVAAGDLVEPGHPLGLLGGKDSVHEEFLIEAKEGGGDLPPETLYIELRNGGVPADPALWFDLSNH